MRKASIRVLALACLAALGLGTSANAATIFAFSQSDVTNTGLITATATSSNTTTLTTNSTPDPGSIPIVIGTEGLISPNLLAVETFVGVTATGPASPGVSESISGTINFNLPPTAGGALILSITFSTGVLEGTGNSGDIRGSQPGTGIVTLLVGPAGGAILTALPGISVGQPFSGAFSNSLVNVTPTFSISGTTIASFTATTAGNVSASVVPEPASFVMMGTTLLAGLGVFGCRRLKVSRV
jgi:hypothetical protein